MSIHRSDAMRLSEVLAIAETQSQRRGIPMVVVSDGLRFVAVSLRSWAKFGENFAPHWRGEMLVRWSNGVTTVAVYSEPMVTKWRYAA